MNTKDLEEYAIARVKDLIHKNRDCMSSFMNENDKTPLWDGNIFIYDNVKKNNKSFKGKIDVQVKGQSVNELLDTCTYEMEIDKLIGYQKECKGTLLFVLCYVSDDNYGLYYCNLLPVDLYQILLNVSSSQITKTLHLKRINENSPLNFRNVVLNFFNNSIRQANKKIINVDEFDKIENISLNITSDIPNVYDFMLFGDVYTYAFLKNTSEEVVTVKGDWTPFTEINAKVGIDGISYYDKYIITGKNEDEIVIGPFTIGKKMISMNFNGDIKKRINDLSFAVDFLNKQYLSINDETISLEITDNNVSKNIMFFEKQLKYLKNISNAFSILNTSFDVPLENLNNEDIKNLNILVELITGNNDIYNQLETRKYYILIDKYKFIIFVNKDKKEFYNYYSRYMIDNYYCSYNENPENQISLYSNIISDEIVGVNNFNKKIIYDSIKKLEVNEYLCESLNYMIIAFIDSYDRTGNTEFLNIASHLNKIIINYDNNDIAIINSKQIKIRKSKLSSNDFKILKSIEEKEENGKNYLVKCAVNILLGNDYLFKDYFKKMSKKDKEIFITWPIYKLKK